MELMEMSSNVFIQTEFITQVKELVKYLQYVSEDDLGNCLMYLDQALNPFIQKLKKPELLRNFKEINTSTGVGTEGSFVATLEAKEDTSKFVTKDISSASNSNSSISLYDNCDKSGTSECNQMFNINNFQSTVICCNEKINIPFVSESSRYCTNNDLDSTYTNISINSGQIQNVEENDSLNQINNIDKQPNNENLLINSCIQKLYSDPTGNGQHIKRYIIGSSSSSEKRAKHELNVIEEFDGQFTDQNSSDSLQDSILCDFPDSSMGTDSNSNILVAGSNEIESLMSESFGDSYNVTHNDMNRSRISNINNSEGNRDSQSLGIDLSLNDKIIEHNLDENDFQCLLDPNSKETKSTFQNERNKLDSDIQLIGGIDLHCNKMVNLDPVPEVQSDTVQGSGDTFCFHCNASLKNQVIYRKHMASHRKNTCSKCPMTFHRRQLLHEHLERAHGVALDPKSFSCSRCLRKFVKKSNLYRHLQTHLEADKKACLICGEIIEAGIFEDHMNEHAQTSKLRCHICKSVFQRRQQYDCHMKGHDIYVCEYCEDKISFSSKKRLFTHCRRNHPYLPSKVRMEKSYQCSECPRVFNRPSVLREHKLNHQRQNYFECRLCKRKYASRSSLVKHHKNNHSLTQDGVSKGKIFCCDQCDFVVSSFADFKQHCLSVHNIEINFTCKLCNYKTSKRTLLRKHISNKHKEKKFLCDLCGSLFASRYNLNHHSYFAHSSKRDFKCDVCTKTFKSGPCLSRHARTHTNEKPFVCECGSSYKQISHLKRHKLTAHNELIENKKQENSTLDNRQSDRTLPSSKNEETGIQTTVSDGNAPLSEPSNSLDLRNQSANSSLVTLYNTQLIQLVPSNCLTQENVPTLSLVNGDVQTLAVGHTSFITPSIVTLKTNSSGEVIIPHIQTVASKYVPDTG